MKYARAAAWIFLAWLSRPFPRWRDDLDDRATLARFVCDGDFEPVRVVGPPRLGNLYAVRHDGEWYLALWDGECWDVIGTSIQAGDRWLPEWVSKAVPVDP